jgi:hypothetical protein
MDGRFINPPFLFGAGGVELLAKEMTQELQAIQSLARDNPGVFLPLVTKGVDFGTIGFVDGRTVTHGVEGVDPDLVVRPFGRKGGFATVRAFALGAFAFHFGIQPTEVVGEGADPDEDGVADEVLAGEVSAVHTWASLLAPPRRERERSGAQEGLELFEEIGCADCHVPELHTVGRHLTLSFPELETDPAANVYLELDLSKPPVRLARSRDGRLRVPLHSDLKRHAMGPALSESTGDALDPWFITARLWGVADSAPYLHDGRATTLTDAILLHGGEAQASRDLFANLVASEREVLLSYLRSLRTPRDADRELVARGKLDRLRPR